MERKEIYQKIYESTDTNYLMDLFYERVNNYRPIDNIDICVKIANRINSLKEELNQDEMDLMIELNNLYLFCLNELAGVEYHLKYKKEYDYRDVNKKMYLGFNIISKKTKEDPDTKAFISRKMVEDIVRNKYANHNVDVERDIHKRFDTKEALEKNGIVRTFIDLVYVYDPYLADYIACNPSVLDCIKDKLDKYITNFDLYEEKNKERKLKFLIEDVKEYCEENELDYKSHLLRLSAEFGVLNDVLKHSEEYKDLDYVTVKDYIISENRNEIDMHYVRLRKVFDYYKKEKIVLKRYGQKSDEEILKEKMLDYIMNMDNMTEEEQLSKASEIESLISSDETFDKVAYDIINHTNLTNDNILKFKKGN